MEPGGENTVSSESSESNDCANSTSLEGTGLVSHSSGNADSIPGQTTSLLRSDAVSDGVIGVSDSRRQ